MIASRYISQQNHYFKVLKRGIVVEIACFLSVEFMDGISKFEPFKVSKMAKVAVQKGERFNDFTKEMDIKIL